MPQGAKESFVRPPLIVDFATCEFIFGPEWDTPGYRNKTAFITINLNLKCSAHEKVKE